MNFSKGIGLAVSLALSSTAVSISAIAQTDQDEDTREEALRRIQSLEESERDAVDAARYLRIEGGPVSLDQVLRDPDNIALNYRYAQTQIADGNLRGASAALERILLLNPNLPQIRLFYAFVLLRLDDALEARAQLALVDKSALSPEARAQAEELDTRIRRRTDKTHFYAALTGGFSYQTNASFAPESEEIDVIVDFFGIPIPLVDVPTDGPEDDFAYIARARLGFTHDLGFQEGHELFGSAGFLYDNQVTVDTTDSTDYSVNLGGTLRTEAGDLIGQLVAGHFSLDRDSFLTDYGVDLAWERQYLDDDLSTLLRGRVAIEDYDDADGNTPEQTGGRYELEVGALYRLRANQRVGAAVEYDDKWAREEWREFDHLEFRLHHTWLIKRGVFVRNLVSYANEGYDAPNPRISVRRRHDHEYRYRFTVGIPLGNLVKGLPKGIRDVRLLGSAEYEHTESNVQNFEFDDVTGELLFTKRFEF